MSSQGVLRRASVRMAGGLKDLPRNAAWILSKTVDLGGGVQDTATSVAFAEFGTSTRISPETVWISKAEGSPRTSTEPLPVKIAA